MSATEPTPQERLASSRRAIVRHMTRDHKGAREAQRHESDGLEGFGDFDGEPVHEGTGTWSVIKGAIRSWWHYHPANVAFDFARPMINQYAEDKPYKLLGIAAGVGAAAVVLRPWRLMSLGGIALAAVKSSGLSSLVLSMISNPLAGASSAGGRQQTQQQGSTR